MVRGLIFDCDGVLLDSLKANVAFYSAVLRELGLPAIADDDHEKVYLCHTVTTPEVFAALLGPEQAERAVKIAAAIDYRQFIPLIVPEPGIMDLLAELSSTMPLAVATNRGNSMHDLSAYFGLDRYFSAILTSRDVVNGKPHPDLLLLASERLKLPVTDLLFVGDMDVDREAARRAGMAFVGYKGHFPDSLTIQHHQELPQIIRSISTGSGRPASVV